MKPSAPYAGAVIGALFGLSAVAAYLWPLGFSAFPPLAAILLLPFYRPRDPSPAFLCLLALAFVMLISLAWSPVFAGQQAFTAPGGMETQTWAKLLLQLALYAALVTVAATRIGPESRRLRAVFVWGTCALALLLFIEALSGAAIYQALRQAIGDPIRPDLAERNVAQGTFLLALMMWPAWSILGDWGHKRLRVGLLAIAVAAPILLGSQAPALAILVGGAVHLVSRARPRRAAWMLGAAAALTVLAAPWVVLAARPLFETIGAQIGPSWAARLDIWRTAAEATTTAPWLGHGLDASRLVITENLHPHNAMLQVWLEFGALGAVLFALFWLALTNEAGRRGGQALATAAVYFVIGGLSFGVWQEWWIGAGATACLWALIAARNEQDLQWDIEA